MKRFSKDEVDFDRIYHFGKDDDVDFVLAGIRNVNEKHIANIYNDIMSDNVKWMAPIEVNVFTWGVSDGQNRYEAAKRAWADGKEFDLSVIFRYEEDQDEERRIICKKNSSQKSWTQKDYKLMYIKAKNSSVLLLDKFCLEHELCHGKINRNGKCATKDRYAMSFLKGANVTNELKEGTLSIDKDDYDFGHTIYPEVIRIYELCGYTSTAGWFESLIQGWYEFRSSTKYSKRYNAMGGTEEYMKAIEADIADGKFNKEQVQSKQVWVSRFVTVMTNHETAKFNNLS